jgi:hypothetical protein
MSYYPRRGKSVAGRSANHKSAMGNRPMSARQLDLLSSAPCCSRPHPGTRRQWAVWLRDALAAGRLTRGTAAAAVAIDPPDVDELLTGRVTLATTAWRRVARAAMQQARDMPPVGRRNPGFRG